MSVCTFFGHSDAPKEIEPILRSTLIDLIENKDVWIFYVGDNGNFDLMVRYALKQLKKIYPYVRYSVVLSSIANKTYVEELGCNTMFPDGLERTPPRYAIAKRNRWMIEHSGLIVAYITHDFGGAAKFKALAERKGKTVINLADLTF